MLHHPLMIIPVIDAYPGGVSRINEMYRKKKAERAEAERGGDWWQYVFLHEKPYRVRHLLKALPNINDPRLAAPLVRSVWTDSENIRQHRSIWISIWSELPDPKASMDENERKEFATFPNRLRIFRGQSGRRGLTGGLSWTTDKSKAEWFARRFLREGQRGFIVSGRVPKSDVYAYFTDRKESEVVVHPDKVCDMIVANVLTNERQRA